MTVIIKIAPPKIAAWLSREEKKRALLLLDLEADEIDNKSLRLDLNVVFNSIPIRRGFVNTADFYVGTSGAEIVLEALHGEIREYSQAQTLDVNYSNTITRIRKSSLALSAGFGKRVSERDSADIRGNITFHAQKESKFSAAFSSLERTLVPICAGNSVKWVVCLPRGEKVIRDYLIGNLYLYAECVWSSSRRSGSIMLRSSDVRFFDADRRPLGPRASLLMQYHLWRKGVRVFDRDGFSITFSAQSGEV